MKRPRKPIPVGRIGQLGPCLHRGVSYDMDAADGLPYVITEDYVAGYVVISRHPTVAAAMRALEQEGK
jgi:hypothetical protein